MNDFIYDVPTKVYFGEQIDHLGDELKKFGSRVLMVYGGGSIKKNGIYDDVVKSVTDASLELFELSGVEPNPRITTVRRGVKKCKDNAVDVILAVGGGSTIDAAKGIAAGAKVDFDPWEFYVGTKKIQDALPIVTVLTNSATGSEMNVNSVVSNEQTKDKLGTKGRAVLPQVSFLNPEYTFSVNAYHTACGAADILSHVFEAYFNLNDDLYMLDCVMEGLMKTVIKYAPIAIANPSDYEARANLMWASSWALNGFIRGGKSQGWSCHPIEHELSAIYDVTHGLGLAILTPRWMKYCLNEKTAYKFAQFGINVFGIDENLDDMEIAEKAIGMLSEFLFGTLNLKSTLTEIGIGKENFAVMAKKACRGSECIKGFLKLYPGDIEKILEMCL